MSIDRPGVLHAGWLLSHPSIFDMTFHDLHLTSNLSFGGEDGVVYANPGVIPPPISRPDIIDNAGHDGGHDVDDEDSEDEDELEEPTPRKPSRLRRFR